MKFNQYVWDLYKNSREGKKSIKESSVVEIQKELESEIEESKWPVNEKYQENFNKEPISFSLIEEVKKYILSQNIKTIEDANTAYERMVTEGIPLKSKNKDGKLSVFEYFGDTGYENGWYDYIDTISFGLYFAYPEFFLPYCFSYDVEEYDQGFDNLEDICKLFEISLPSLPNRRNDLEKALYYGQINKVLYDFRMENQLSPEEMCAFLNDFALNIIHSDSVEEKIKDLPAPSKVWLVMVGKDEFDRVDDATEDTIYNWSGNMEMRGGDILLMYCKAPRSYIHSIWRALDDGFIEPFSYFFSRVRICSSQIVEPVSLNEMKEDQVLSKSGLIRRNLKGVSGDPFSVEEYNAILKIMKKKGQDISILPKMKNRTYSPDIVIDKERDVEKKLIEPLLRNIGYSEKDWIRQMSIKMGRGERNYPDYAFKATEIRGYERAVMVLEAKYQISSRREKEDAFMQACSYALRLKSKMMVLASQEGIWIYPENKQDFKPDNFIHKNWKELGNLDTLHEINSIIGKKKIFGL